MDVDQASAGVGAALSRAGPHPPFGHLPTTADYPSRCIVNFQAAYREWLAARLAIEEDGTEEVYERFDDAAVRVLTTPVFHSPHLRQKLEVFRYTRQKELDDGASHAAPSLLGLTMLENDVTRIYPLAAAEPPAAAA